MAYVAPPTHNPGDLITASDWNQYIQQNWASLTGLIAYTNSSSPLSGWTEFTTARGLFIVGLVSGGTLATAVGTPLTNQQAPSHNHTVARDWGTGGGSSNGRLLTDSSGGGGPPGGTSDAPFDILTGQSAANPPYLQLLCIQHS